MTFVTYWFWRILGDIWKFVFDESDKKSKIMLHKLDNWNYGSSICCDVTKKLLHIAELNELIPNQSQSSLQYLHHAFCKEILT
jgi:hypothetical protein